MHDAQVLAGAGAHGDGVGFHLAVADDQEIGNAL